MKIDVGLRLSDITFDGAKPDDICPCPAPLAPLRHGKLRAHTVMFWL